MTQTTIFGFMSRDHDRLDALFEEFGNLPAGETDKARALFREFRDGLERHIEWEEEILFPIFERETGMVDSGPTAVMRMEHREIGAVLDKIGEEIGKAAFGGIDALGTGLLNILGPHNQKEEHILYPAIDNLTGEEEREQVIHQMSGLSPDNPV